MPRSCASTRTFQSVRLGGGEQPGSQRRGTERYIIEAPGGF